MPSPGKRFSFRFAPWLASFLILASGCDKTVAPKLFPVTGTVMVGKTPLSVGMVTFHPDASKGNKLAESPFGTIGADGTYKLLTGGKDGAPVGWYKVTVSPIGMPKEMPAIGQPISKTSSVDARFQKVETTPLSIEIVESPVAGAYDFQLK